MINTIYQTIKSKIPLIIKQTICSFIELPFLLIARLKCLKNYFLLKAKIKSGHKVKVCFYALNISMWKCDGIYNLMKNSNIFEPLCVIVPRQNETHEERLKDAEELEHWFVEKKYNFINLYSKEGYNNLPTNLKPDILFYPQPYGGLVADNLSWEIFSKSLLCYIPYAMRSIGTEWGYNTMFQKSAWKLFYETDFHKQLAGRYCLLGSKNVSVAGATVYDKFFDTNFIPKNIWKSQNIKKKKVIWAPHHSIESKPWLDYSSFFEICDFMPQIAQKYSDKIQFCFKPHPMLITKLYKIWGKEKTNAYYELWKNMPNTQYENGEYIDLFMTSDAMIHDCDSFRFEYLFTEKPVAYVKKDKYRNEPIGISKTAFDLHYNTNTKEKIEDFLVNVVLDGNDCLLEKRKEFKQKYLMPPNGKTASENIYNEIIKALDIKA